MKKQPRDRRKQQPIVRDYYDFPQDVYQSRTIADAAARITSPSFYIEAKMFRVSTAALAEHIISIIPNTAVRGGAPPRGDVTSRAGSATNGGDS